MDDRYDFDVPSGGHARGRGGCFHLSFRSGSRAGGASGAAAFDYITRYDRYDDESRDPVVYAESKSPSFCAPSRPELTLWPAMTDSAIFCETNRLG